MKRNLLSIVTLSFLFVLPVSAQDTTDFSEANIKLNDSVKSRIRTEEKDRRAEFKERLEDKRKDLQEGREERREIKTIRSEFKTEMAKVRLEKTIKIFVATANRLDKIVTRIESRISKIEAAGGKVGDIRISLDLSKAKLVEARTEIEVFATTELSSATSTTAAKGLFEDVKIAAFKAKVSLKAVHASLVETITLIRGMEKTIKVPEDSEVEIEVNNSN